MVIARACEPYGIAWMEDMIQPNNAADLALLASGTGIPQCVSERLVSRFAYRDIFAHHAARIAMVDVVWTGGITEAMKIAILADAINWRSHRTIVPARSTWPLIYIFVQRPRTP